MMIQMFDSFIEFINLLINPVTKKPKTEKQNNV